jgi:hypothetical protein
MEKVLLKKFFFMKEFTEDAKDQKLQMAFMRRIRCLIFGMKIFVFFKRFKQLRNNPGNIFQKVKELNQLQTILPVDVKKTKLDNSIKDLIFNEFRFKYVNKSSTNQIIVKEVINTFFQRFIISTKQDKSKHVTYEIKDKDVLDQFYHFGNSFLRMNVDIETMSYEEGDDMNESIMDL